jgi:hypothetical protein
VLAGGSFNNTQGAYSVCVGGSGNLVYGNYSAALGGYSNTINPQLCFVAGASNNLASNVTGESLCFGFNNNVASAFNTVTIGKSHSNSGNYGTILGGQSNNCNASYGTVTGGRNNRAWGQDSIALGGNTNHALYDGSIAMGKNAFAIADYTRAYSANQFAAQGDAQLVEAILQRSTTAAVATELSIGGAAPTANTAFSVSTDTSYSFDILITARRTDVNVESAAWEIKGLISNDAGTTSFIGTPTTTLIAAAAGAASWTVTPIADNTNDRLAIFVLGENLKTIYWVAHVRAVKVTG